MKKQSWIYIFFIYNWKNIEQIDAFKKANSLIYKYYDLFLKIKNTTYFYMLNSYTWKINSNNQIREELEKILTKDEYILINIINKKIIKTIKIWAYINNNKYYLYIETEKPTQYRIKINKETYNNILLIK